MNFFLKFGYGTPIASNLGSGSRPEEIVLPFPRCYQIGILLVLFADQTGVVAFRSALAMDF